MIWKARWAGVSQSHSKHMEKGSDVFKHLATVTGRKSQTDWSGTLVNCLFSGHSSIEAPSPVLLLVEEEKGLQRQSHFFFYVCF